jgi:hypothetical protein
MKAKAHVVHSLRGRTRLRIPERRGDHAFFGEIEKRLLDCAGVSGVDSNPLTGSVLVHHTIDIESLIMQAAAGGLGELVELTLSSPPLARRVRAEVVAIDKAVRQLTAGELDLTTVASIGLLAMAGIQLVRGQQPVLVASLAWYASELLHRWEEPDQAAAPARQG